MLHKILLTLVILISTGCATSDFCSKEENKETCRKRAEQRSLRMERDRGI